MDWIDILIQTDTELNNKSPFPSSTSHQNKKRHQIFTVISALVSMKKDPNTKANKKIRALLSIVANKTKKDLAEISHLILERHEVDLIETSGFWDKIFQCAIENIPWILDLFSLKYSVSLAGPVLKKMRDDGFFFAYDSYSKRLEIEDLTCPPPSLCSPYTPREYMSHILEGIDDSICFPRFFESHREDLTGEVEEILASPKVLGKLYTAVRSVFEQLVRCLDTDGSLARLCGLRCIADLLSDDNRSKSISSLESIKKYLADALM